ncbi:hypothetical protein HYX10_04795 [Candidatus Woesearchaeota archaeon]|nr:hypothetical protein [Candidatus Woesearchaeota archaeon]
MTFLRRGIYGFAATSLLVLLSCSQPKNMAVPAAAEISVPAASVQLLATPVAPPTIDDKLTLVRERLIDDREYVASRINDNPAIGELLGAGRISVFYNLRPSELADAIFSALRGKVSDEQLSDTVLSYTMPGGAANSLLYMAALIPDIRFYGTGLPVIVHLPVYLIVGSGSYLQTDDDVDLWLTSLAKLAEEYSYGISDLGIDSLAEHARFGTGSFTPDVPNGSIGQAFLSDLLALRSQGRILDAFRQNKAGGGNKQYSNSFHAHTARRYDQYMRMLDDSPKTKRESAAWAIQKLVLAEYNSAGSTLH